MSGFLAEWFDSMDISQINQLKENSELHISVRTGVSDATLDKVKRCLKDYGIDKISVSNFLPCQVINQSLNDQ